MKKFTTIVTHIENLELRKDTGQIPYHLYKLKNYDATLVTYFYTLSGGRSAGPVKNPPVNIEKISKEYPFLKSEVDGLKLHFLTDEGRGKFYEKAILKYLKSHSREIDILNLFHFSPENILYTLIYKLLNPRGRVYIKLDIDIHYYQSRNYLFNQNTKLLPLKKFFFDKILLPLFFKLVHTVSAESEKGFHYFLNRFKISAKKLSLVLNGVDEKKIEACLRQSILIKKKENIILSVGRIGSTQKNNKMLLEALAHIDLADWKVYFTGPVEKAFEAEIAKFYSINPHIKDKVFFTGAITSPGELYDIYNRSKLFCLTSLHEGFPLSACEAAYFGNYLILTDSIQCFKELTGDGRYGCQVSLNNSEQLASKISMLIKDEEFFENHYKEMRQYARENLTWQTIIPRLDKRLQT